MAIYIGPILVFALLALIQEAAGIRFGRVALLLALLTIGIISGVRFECGQDWPAYEEFFNNLDAAVGPWESFTSHNSRPAFEIGFHILNWGVKWIGGSYSIVMLLASLFCVYALYKVLVILQINRFYVLAMYASYSYLILQFAQVRQCIAMAFLLLACAHYIVHRNRWVAISIASLGALFQYSTLMYLVTFVLALYWPKRMRAIVRWCVLILVILLVSRGQVDFYGLLSVVAYLEFAQTKLTIYEATQEAQGAGVVFLAGFLSLLAGYVANYLPRIEERHQFIGKFALVSTFLTIVMIVIFPNSYVMFSRAYVLASLMLAISIAMILSRSTGVAHVAVFSLSIIFSVAYCYRLLNFYSDEYLPYKTFLGDLIRRTI